MGSTHPQLSWSEMPHLRGGSATARLMQPFPCGHAPCTRYTEVFRLVSSFVSQAEAEHPEMVTIMLLGMVKELAQHKDPSL